MKNILHNKLFFFLLGFILTSGITVFAAIVNANDIKYTPNDSNWNVENVEEAINDLYKNRNEINNFKGEFRLSAYDESNNNAKESYVDINVNNYKNLKITISDLLTGENYSSYYECKVYGDNTEILSINEIKTYEINVEQYSNIRIYYKENIGWYKVIGNYELSN